MLDACFSHLHFCQSLPMPQRSLSAIADLLVIENSTSFEESLLQSFFVWKLSAAKL